MKSTVFAVLAVLLIAAPSNAATVTIAAFDSGHDTRSDSTSGNSQDRDITLLGAVSSTRIHRATLEFDLSSIPDNATINSVDLVFESTDNDANSGSSGGDITAHELLTDPDAVNGWNWNAQSFGVDTTGGTADDVLWTTPGGDIGAALATLLDADFDPTNADGVTHTIGSTAGLIGAVSGNLADDLLYLQLVNDGDSATRYFLRVEQNGSDGELPAFRLNVDFSVPPAVPEPTSLVLAMLGGVMVAVRKRR